MKKIVIAGGSGLIGRALSDFLSDKGYTVVWLTRNTSLVAQEPAKNFYWNPSAGEIDTKVFKDAAVVINLAGTPISKRWTKSNKKDILNSRVKSVNTLQKAIAELKSSYRPKVINASAIGIYESSKSLIHDEYSTNFNSSFLGEVVEKWEDCVADFDKINVPYCILRIGIVMSKKGGALKELLKPAKFGFMAPLGGGRQWQSWIALEDLLQLIKTLIENPITGVVNAVAPKPIVQAEMTRLLSKKIGVLYLPLGVPSLVLRLLLGQMSAVVLESQHVQSAKIDSDQFRHQNFTSFLNTEFI